MRRWRTSVPVARLQPLADEFPAERVLSAARLPCLGEPESARVRGENLVGQDQVSAMVGSEFELCVRDEDPLSGGELGGALIKLNAQSTDLFGEFDADYVAHLRDRHVLVMAVPVLDGGRKDRLWQAVAVPKRPGQ